MKSSLLFFMKQKKRDKGFLFERKGMQNLSGLSLQNHLKEVNGLK